MNSQYYKSFEGIKTRRLLIRKASMRDINAIFEFTSYEETSKKLSWYPHQNTNITKDFIHSLIKKYENDIPSQWVIELLAEEKAIGILGFIEHNTTHRKAELAYVLSPFYQNKGYMTEAIIEVENYGFKTMKINRIEAKCEIDNFASERVMQKSGMRLEGCLYDYLFRKDKLRSFKIYAIHNKGIVNEKK